MTWKELKDFCNSLPKNQLERKVILWREDEAINNISAELLTEDHYMGEGYEYCYPLSDAGLTIDDVSELKLKKVYSEGDAILNENV